MRRKKRKKSKRKLREKKNIKKKKKKENKKKEKNEKKGKKKKIENLILKITKINIPRNLAQMITMKKKINKKNLNLQTLILKH